MHEHVRRVIDQSKVGSFDIAQFVTSLVTNIGILLVEVFLFSFLRNHVRKIYSPRVFLPPAARRSPPIGKGLFAWIPTILRIPSTEIIPKNGIDAYVFLRFLRILLKIFSVSTVVTMVVLVPINVIHSNHQQSGYFRIAWGDLPDNLSVRYTAHVVVAYFLTAFVLYLLQDELRHVTSLRHAYLTSKAHSKHAQSRTVLITGIPQSLLNERDLRQFTSFVPGGVSRIWIYRESKVLTELYEERLTACSKAETAATHILTKATKATNKRIKAALKKHKDVDQPELTQAAFDDLVPVNKRPHHRVGFLGLMGEKVDTLEWAKKTIPDLDHKIALARADLKNVKPAGSAFIELNLQLGAHVLTQCVSYHEPLVMTDKWTEVDPHDVIWDNIDDGTYEVRARFLISWGITFALIIFFGVPVTFIQSLTSLSDLCVQVSWLAWVCKAPKIAVGLLQGVLPPLLMAILFILVPVILRLLSLYECVPRYTMVSERVYDRFFLFLIVHGFLVAFIAGGLLTSIPRMLDRPSTALTELASNLPSAATYFLAYLFATGMSGAGSAFLQAVPLVIHFLKKKFLGRTPREAYSASLIMPSIDFGVIMPPISLLATIGLSYVVLNPLVNVFSTIAVGMLWFAYKYMFLYVFDQPEKSETGGLYFPRAASNLFVGLYITQVTIATLLFLRLAMQKLVYHQSFKDLIINNLPMSLATKHMRERFEHERNKAGIDFSSDDIDLFNRDHIQTFIKSRVKKTASAIQQEITKITASSSSIAGSSTSVNRHPSAPVGPTVTVTGPAAAAPPPPPPPPAPFSGQNRHDEEVQVAKDAELDDTDDELDDQAFNHPATYKKAPVIWVPKDPFGYSEVLVQDLKHSGVEASDLGSTLGRDGVVKVNRTPPDEAWEGGTNV
ncbi:DUF221 family protein [Auriculariales sp. MPI-PUGE-AT-0066]|nr:DUF221 family protein [Auriculariales sp. MPI-PUGE-AT-0066]